MLIPGVTRTQIQTLPALVADYPWCFAAGFHPFFLEQHQSDDLPWLARQLEGERGQGYRAQGLVAVGECGLHLTRSTPVEIRRVQQEWFETQVVLARTSRLPLILHGVGAHDLIVSTLRRLGCHSGGVIHAFSGSEQQARRYLDMGIRIGVGATFFHPGARRLRRTLSTLPADAVLLETDTPDMKAPFWGDDYHSPETIPMIGTGMASLLGLPSEAFKHQLWANLFDTFPNVQSIFHQH